MSDVFSRIAACIACDLKLLTALVVAVFLTIPYWKGKYFTKVPVKKGGKDNA